MHPGKRNPKRELYLLIRKKRDRQIYGHKGEEERTYMPKKGKTAMVGSFGGGEESERKEGKEGKFLGPYAPLWGEERKPDSILPPRKMVKKEEMGRGKRPSAANVAD